MIRSILLGIYHMYMHVLCSGAGGKQTFQRRCRSPHPSAVSRLCCKARAQR